MAPGTCRTTCNSPLHPPGTSLLPLDAHRSDVTKGKRLVDTRETDGCWHGRRQASGALWKNGRPCALRKRDSTPPDDLVRLNVSNCQRLLCEDGRSRPRPSLCGDARRIHATPPNPQRKMVGTTRVSMMGTIGQGATCHLLVRRATSLASSSFQHPRFELLPSHKVSTERRWTRRNVMPQDGCPKVGPIPFVRQSPLLEQRLVACKFTFSNAMLMHGVRNTLCS